MLDPDIYGFGDGTNDLLLEIYDDAEALASNVHDMIERLESVSDMLSKLIDAMPESIFDNDSVDQS